MAGMREADLERLYARLERPLCNIVYRWVWSLDDAQDIVQDAFVRLWRMRARVDLDTVEPLVYRITLNLAASRRRARRRWRWVPLDAVRALTAPAPPADDVMTTTETHARLRAAIESLPDDLRQVILLCAYSTLTYAEMAGVLAVPPGTVGSRRHRALGHLKRLLATGPTPRKP